MTSRRNNQCLKGWGIEVGMPAKQTNMGNDVYGSVRNTYTRQQAQITPRGNICAMYTVPGEYGMVLVIAYLRPSAAHKMQLAALCVLSTASKKTGAGLAAFQRAAWGVVLSTSRKPEGQCAVFHDAIWWVGRGSPPEAGSADFLVPWVQKTTLSCSCG